jgi:putative ABC transport system permease protein
MRPGIRRWLELPRQRGRTRAAEVDEEIRIHLSLLTEELVRAGMTETEARREAERRFGPLDARRADLHRLAQQAARARDRAVWLGGLGHDLRVALRAARRNPALTLVSTLVLGLGIGASTAVFSLFNSVVLRPLPYHDPSRLVVIWQTSRAGSGEFAAGVFDDMRDASEWAARSHSFDALAELTWANGGQVYRPTQGSPREVTAILVSDNFFDLLGVRAQEGRTFSRDDLTGGCAVVLSHSFWQTNFGGDAGAVGSRMTLGDKRCTVLGVMPASFEFYPRETELWSLMNPAIDTLLARHPERYLVGVFGRLRPGVTINAAQRELRAIQASGPDQTPFRRAFTPSVFDLQQEFTWLAGRNLHTTLLMMLAAVALVLLVVCLNIANLSLGRAATREREFAVRVAIGSGRWRLVRQLLTESALLAVCGSILGLAIATLGMHYINSGKAIELPPGASVRLDGVALTAAVVMTAFATIVVGLAPALRASRVNTGDALKASSRGASGDRRSGRAANVLVVSQVSVSVMLLVAAGLLLESLARFGNGPLGYSPDDVLTLRVNVATGDTLVARRVFVDALERARRIPGVNDAAWTSVVPVQGRGSIESVVVEGQTRSARDSVPDVGDQTVSDTYFALMRVPLLAGRGFARGDDDHAAPVALVNRAFVERYIGGASAIGRRIRFGGAKQSWMTIVGVVGNEQRGTVAQEMAWVAPPMVFRPMRQASAPRSMLLLVRTATPSGSLMEEVQRVVRAVSPDAIVSDIATMHELLDHFLASPRVRAESVAALALLAFTLAVIGLYGLLSQLVVYRTRELGIRLALGAEPTEVVFLVVRRGLLLAAVGTALGCIFALPTLQMMRALLYGVTAFNPMTMGAAVVTMLVTAIIASGIPARRAAAVDPVIALRAE